MQLHECGLDYVLIVTGFFSLIGDKFKLNFCGDCRKYGFSWFMVVVIEVVAHFAIIFQVLINMW